MNTNKYLSVFVLIVFLCLILISCKAQTKTLSNKNTTNANSEIEFQNLLFDAQKQLLFDNSEQAEILLHKSISIKSNSSICYFLLSQIKKKSNETQQAEIFAKKAVEFELYNFWYRKNLSDIFLAQSRFSEAAESYLFLANNKYESEQIFSELLHIADIEENIDEQVKYLEILLNNYDFNQENALNLYNLYMKRLQFNKAESILNKLITVSHENLKLYELKSEFYILSGKYNNAKNLNDSLLQMYPNDGSIHLSCASYCKLVNDKIGFFEHITLVFLSDDIELDTKVRILLSNNGEDFTPEQTDKLFDILLENYSNNKIVHILYSDFLLQNDEFREAIQHLQFAIDFDKSDYGLLIKLLQLEFSIKDYQNLFSDSKTYIDYYPLQPLLYFYHGIAAYRISNYTEATEILLTGYQYITDDTDLQAQYLFYIAQSYFYQKYYEESDKYFEKLLLLEPGNPSTAEVYAYSLAFRNINEHKALKLAELALKSNPESSIANFAMALLAFNRQNFKEALNYIDKAYSLEPNNYEISEWYGNILEKSGNNKNAEQKWLQSVKSGNPSEELKIKINYKE